MKTDFLKELGLSEDVIKQIMAENGKDIANEQKKTTTAIEERDNYKSQFETTQETLKQFEGVDVTQLQGKITELGNTLAGKEKEFAEKIAERDFDDMLKQAITDNGGKNVGAIKGCLDIASLKVSKNQKEDIANALKGLTDSDGYLFGKQEPFQNPVGTTGDKTPPTDEASKTLLWKAMGIKE